MSSSPPPPLPPPLTHESSHGSTSTSSGQKTSSSTTEDKVARSHHAKSRRLMAHPLTLKPLAAKSPTLTRQWRPLAAAVNRDPTQKIAQYKPPRKAPVCKVCGRPACQLITHQTWVSRTRKEDPGTAPGFSLVLITDEAYKSSYAYKLTQAYVDPSLGQGRIDAFHNLPLPPDLDISQNHRLFHYYFSFECKQGLEIPKLPYLPDDLVLSPFFTVSMQDPAVCLAVLALAAALLPTNHGLSANEVGALEFSDRAITTINNQTIAGDLPPESVIIAQTFLWATHTSMPRKDAMQGYADSVHSLVRARGGLKSLGWQVEQLIRWIDARHSSMAHVASPYLDAPSPPALAQPPRRKYGAFWETERAEKFLSKDILEVCRSMCRIIEVMEMTFASGMTMPVLMWLMSRLLHETVARSRVLETYEGTGTFDEFVILANELAVQIAFMNPVKYRNGILYQAVPLIKAIKAIEKQVPDLLACEIGDTNLLIWALFLIAIIPHDFEDKGWAKELLCRVIRGQLAGTAMPPFIWSQHVWQSLAQFTWSNLKYRKRFDDFCLSIQIEIFLKYAQS